MFLSEPTTEPGTVDAPSWLHEPPYRDRHDATALDVYDFERYQADDAHEQDFDDAA